MCSNRGTRSAALTRKNGTDDTLGGRATAGKLCRRSDSAQRLRRVTAGPYWLHDPDDIMGLHNVVLAP